MKISIVLNGRRTSVSLEKEFWSALREIGRQRGVSRFALINQINADRTDANLSSVIRLFVLMHIRSTSIIVPSAMAKVPDRSARAGAAFTHKLLSRVRHRKASGYIGASRKR